MRDPRHTAVGGLRCGASDRLAALAPTLCVGRNRRPASLGRLRRGEPYDRHSGHGALAHPDLCIVRYIDHGKTTLSDRRSSGAAPSTPGSCASSTSTAMDIERERASPSSCSRSGSGRTRPQPHRHAGARRLLYESAAAWLRARGGPRRRRRQGLEAQTLATATWPSSTTSRSSPPQQDRSAGAEPDKYAEEIEKVLGIRPSRCCACPKTGEGVDELLDAIVERIPGASATATPRCRH